MARAGGAWRRQPHASIRAAQVDEGYVRDMPAPRGRWVLPRAGAGPTGKKSTMNAPRSLSRFLLAAVPALALLGGCRYDADAVREFLQQPRRPVAGTEYRVQPPDVLSVQSQHVEEIHGRTERVRPDGMINLPLVGEIYVAGLTPQEIEAAIVTAAQEYYAEADATVSVVGFNSHKYYVWGQVSAPGPQSWTGSDTVLDALARAQPTFLAWPERVKVVRPSRPQTGGYATTQPSDKYRRTGVHPEEPEHPREEMTINIMAMVESGDMANNILLMPNDVIYVPPNPLAKVGLALQSLVFPVRPAAEAVRAPATIAAGGAGF